MFINICGSGNVSMEGLDTALDRADYVDEGGIADRNCPCVYGIWKQMKNKVFTSGVNENICINDILGDFLG